MLDITINCDMWVYFIYLAIEPKRMEPACWCNLRQLSALHDYNTCTFGGRPWPWINLREDIHLYIYVVVIGRRLTVAWPNPHQHTQHTRNPKGLTSLTTITQSQTTSTTHFNGPPTIQYISYIHPLRRQNMEASVSARVRASDTHECTRNQHARIDTQTATTTT